MAAIPALILLSSALVVSGQRPFFAGSRPIGYPELVNRTTTTPSGLEDKFGEVTTQRLPIEAQGDRDLIDRLSKLPIDKQPFWFINWQALEAHREKPQTYPLKPSPFLESNFQNTGPISNPAVNPTPGFINPNPVGNVNLANRNPELTNSGLVNNPNTGVTNNQNAGFGITNSGIANPTPGFVSQPQNYPTPGFVNQPQAYPTPGFVNQPQPYPNNGFTNSNANTGFVNPNFANVNVNPSFGNANPGNTGSFKPGSGFLNPNLRGQEPIIPQNANDNVENRYGTETNKARDTNIPAATAAVNTSNENTNVKAVVSNTDNTNNSSSDENEFEDIEVRNTNKKHN